MLMIKSEDADIRVLAGWGKCPRARADASRAREGGVATADRPRPRVVGAPTDEYGTGRALSPRNGTRHGAALFRAAVVATCSLLVLMTPPRVVFDIWRQENNTHQSVTGRRCCRS